MGKETFFTEADKLQEQGQSDAFGPINSSEFRTSSRHRCSEKATAFAVADGHLVAVRQRPDDASSLLNLILIPHGMKHPEVRCFVYINVDSESYFTQDGNFLNTEAQAHNDLISRIIKAHGENASAYTVLCTDDNADYDITDTERMMLSLNGNQPWPVREGDKIGRFNAGEIGFETVLKSMDFPFTLTDAKAANPAIAKDGDSDKEAERRSLMFEDPAVLFPKHKDKFAYGNYVYLDIRIADGLPYRHAYEVPETTIAEGGGWPIARCLSQNNKVDFGIKVLNEDVTGAAVAVRGADSLAGNRDSAVVKWIKDLEAGNDGLSRISIGVEAPRRVQIRILPEANENSSADFVHKHPLDMVFGDYVENIEKVKKMAGIENGSGMRKLMRAQAAPQQETTGIYMLPIAQRETCINYYNDVKALLKADVIIEKFYDKDGILRTNRLYHATIEHVGESKKRIKSTVDDFLPRILNTAENGSFFKLYNKKHQEHSILKNMDGLLQYLNQENWESPDLFLCMTEEEVKLFDSEIPQDKKGASTSFNFKKKDGASGVYELSQTTEFNDNSIPREITIEVFTTSDEKIFATKAYLDSSDLDISLPEIHFRRMEDEVYDFGFDWMRDGRFDKSTSEKPYIDRNGNEGLCYMHQGKLKSMYDKFTINDQIYYVPWLNIKKGKSAILKIESYNTEIFADKKIKITVPEGISIKIGGSVYNNGESISLGDFVKSQNITIKCNEAKDDDRDLEVKFEDQTIGRLKIYRNLKTIENIELVFCNVYFNGSIEHRSEIVQKMVFDLEAQNFNLLYKSGEIYQSVNRFNPFFNSQWESALLSEEMKENTLDLLSQCSVKKTKFQHGEDIIIDIGKLIIEKDGSSIQEESYNMVTTEYEDLDICGINISVQNPYIIVERYSKLINVIQNKNSQTKNNDRIYVYMLPIEIRCVTDKIRKEYSINDNKGLYFHMFSNINDNYIFASGNPYDEFNNVCNILAHEIGHCFGLKHSFDLSISNEVMFKKYKTENVMDYSDNDELFADKKKSFWKWQWDVILKKNQ